MGDLAYPLKIRAHHLLCMLGFRGLGYSPEFIAMMGKVVEGFRSNSTFPITVVTECDVLCASCPHNKENKCVKKVDSERKVKTKDLEVLQRLDLKTGTQITAGKVLARIRGKLTVKDIAEVCQDCEWRELEYCAEGLERLRIT